MRGRGGKRALKAPRVYQSLTREEGRKAENRGRRSVALPRREKARKKVTEVLPGLQKRSFEPKENVTRDRLTARKKEKGARGLYRKAKGIG